MNFLKIFVNGQAYLIRNEKKNYDNNSNFDNIVLKLEKYSSIIINN